RRIYIGNSEAKNYFKSLISKVIYTGNPIRKFNMVSKKQALHHWNFEEKRTMFVYGGSQGSHSVNQNFVEIIDELLDKEIQILFQTGRKEYGKIIDRFQNREGIVIKPFFDNIEYAYLASDLVICRAGAISLSEIAHFGLPVIIIPFPYSAGQHQLKNALSYNRYGAADILTENELNPKLLLESILKIIKNDTKLKKMSNAIKKLSVSESAKKIVIDIMSSL
ncbi:MAG: UDP-N-acetylglucosamine--N-acetylmuramyl-(pentapeptide) pyrophosphoryl-undecaprenol N-acetylglucosamine transferase, partial [Candidatus Cloacimonetes bacterium]|nr:UDP-N-acetylglucosamine--N-acetylmuramyl-(pentapeptide) pyrophosphoryl-undecaprenol N-acetylglucosamine transferase [Candidatus Cloacimonadota bacterium]